MHAAPIYAGGNSPCDDVCSTRHVDSSLLPCFQLRAPAAFTNNRKVNLPFIYYWSTHSKQNGKSCNILKGKEWERCNEAFPSSWAAGTLWWVGRSRVGARKTGSLLLHSPLPFLFHWVASHPSGPWKPLSKSFQPAVVADQTKS